MAIIFDCVAAFAHRPQHNRRLVGLRGSVIRLFGRGHDERQAFVAERIECPERISSCMTKARLETIGLGNRRQSITGTPPQRQRSSTDAKSRSERAATMAAPWDIREALRHAQAEANCKAIRAALKVRPAKSCSKLFASMPAISLSLKVETPLVNLKGAIGFRSMSASPVVKPAHSDGDAHRLLLKQRHAKRLAQHFFEFGLGIAYWLQSLAAA